jgi:hypothetical protein
MTRLELGGDAQSLVNAGRGALRPSAADRQRNLEALRHRIGDFSGVQHGSPAPAPAPATPGLSAKALAWTAGALGLGGTVIALSLAPRAPEPPRAAPPPAITAAPTAVPPAVTVTQAAAPSDDNVAVAPAVTSTEARSAAARRDSLAEEVSILSRAETELHAGRPGNALALLDEHQRKFPRGALTQERIAARIHALCALGRVSEAEAALSRLRRVSPGSLHEATAREACAPNSKR